jgi:hypothetical protein
MDLLAGVAMTAVIAVLGGFIVRVDREADHQVDAWLRAVPRLMSTEIRRTGDPDRGRQGTYR